MLVSLLIFIVGMLFGIIVVLAIYTDQYRSLSMLYENKKKGNYEDFSSSEINE